MIGVSKKKKNNIRKTSVTLNELMTFKKKYRNTRIMAQRNAQSFQCSFQSTVKNTGSRNTKQDK